MGLAWAHRGCSRARYAYGMAKWDDLGMVGTPWVSRTMSVRRVWNVLGRVQARALYGTCVALVGFSTACYTKSAMPGACLGIVYDVNGARVGTPSDPHMNT
jgi:hypothetical protein